MRAKISETDIEFPCTRGGTLSKRLMKIMKNFSLSTKIVCACVFFTRFQNDSTSLWSTNAVYATISGVSRRSGSYQQSIFSCWTINRRRNKINLSLLDFNNIIKMLICLFQTSHYKTNTSAALFDRHLLPFLSISSKCLKLICLIWGPIRRPYQNKHQHDIET